jgi:hypothetical protein
MPLLSFFVELLKKKKKKKFLQKNMWFGLIDIQCISNCPHFSVHLALMYKCRNRVWIMYYFCHFSSLKCKYFCTTVPFTSTEEISQFSHTADLHIQSDATRCSQNLCQKLSITPLPPLLLRKKLFNAKFEVWQDHRKGFTKFISHFKRFLVRATSSTSNPRFTNGATLGKHTHVPENR